MVILIAYIAMQILYRSVEASDQKVEIVIEDADYIFTATTESPTILLSMVEGSIPRIIIEYADFMSDLNLDIPADELSKMELAPRIVVEYSGFICEFMLQGSSDLNQLATTVKSRIAIEYADAITTMDLQRPLFLPPLINNLTAFQANASYPQPGIVVISYNVIDARQFVTVKFQYWDGDQWIDCTTTTGEGVVPTGSNTGTWNAKADLNNYYTTNMKIRIIVNNGKAISSSETSIFILDTKDPPSLSIFSPLNGTFINERTPTLDWSEVSDPSGVKYDLEVDEDPEFESPLLIKIGLSRSEYDIASSALKEALKDGTYYWRVRAVDNMGNRGSWVSGRFTIDTTPPKADAGSDQTVDEDALIMLNGSGSTDENGIINYTWMLPSGDVLHGMTVTYVFENPGTYIITLIVTDPAGNYAKDEVTIKVLDKTKPIARAIHKIIFHLIMWTVNFDASDSTDNVGIIEYEWNFGDGVSATGRVVSHTYLTAGVYNVTLKVRDAAGNTDIAYIRINTILSTSYWYILLLTLITTFAVAVNLIVILRKRKRIKE
jgi:hypothetical protein